MKYKYKLMQFKFSRPANWGITPARIIVTLLALIVAYYSIQGAWAWDSKDFSDELLSPITTDAVYPLAIGTGLTLTTLAIRNPLGQRFEERQINRKLLGSYSSWGDYAGQMVPNAAYMALQGYLGHLGDPNGYDRAMGMFKATMYASAVTTVLKYSIRAPRPNDSSVRNSFPSGHSATVFAFSGYVAAEHGWGWGSAATLVSIYSGYSRVHDQMHRIHEVAAGATIGWVYGWGISRLQKKKNGKEESGMVGGFTVAPILDLDVKGLALYKEF